METEATPLGLNRLRHQIPHPPWGRKMWEVLTALLSLLVVIISILWRRMSNQPCSDEEEMDELSEVKFLLNRLVESRWSSLSYKLLYRHRHHRGHTSADAPLAAGSAAAASVSVQTAPTAPAEDRLYGPFTWNPDVPRIAPPCSRWTQTEIVLPEELPETSPPTRRTPLCPRCERPMIMRRNRTNKGLFWGCVTYPACKGTRQGSWRPEDSGDDQQRR